VQINLSTTTEVVDGLSVTFASNVGGDDTVVFGPGPLALSSAAVGGPPRAFDIVIDILDFLFDPGLGNLLLDVRNFGGGSTTPFDLENTLGDSVSRISTTVSGVGAANADFDDTGGLIVKFSTSPVVPGPGTLLLLGSGLLGLGGVALTRRRRA
jgi:hypothetical protein